MVMFGNINKKDLSDRLDDIIFNVNKFKEYIK